MSPASICMSKSKKFLSQEAGLLEAVGTQSNKLFTANLKLLNFWPEGTIGCFAVLPDTLAPFEKTNCEI